MYLVRLHFDTQNDQKLSDTFLHVIDTEGAEWSTRSTGFTPHKGKKRAAVWMKAEDAESCANRYFPRYKFSLVKVGLVEANRLQLAMIKNIQD